MVLGIGEPGDGDRLAVSIDRRAVDRAALDHPVVGVHSARTSHLAGVQDRGSNVADFACRTVSKHHVGIAAGEQHGARLATLANAWIDDSFGTQSPVAAQGAIPQGHLATLFDHLASVEPKDSEGPLVDRDDRYETVFGGSAVAVR